MALADSRISNRPVRNRAGTARNMSSERDEATTNKLILILYTISVIWPIKFQIGPIYMTVSRMMLLMLLIPMLARLFSGRFGGIKLPDYLIIFYGMWVFVAMSVNHGPLNIIESSTINFVEVIGAYLIGRIFIRTMEDFEFFIRCMLYAVLFSLPFAMMETQTGKSLILETLRASNPAPDIFLLPADVDYEARLGLLRAQFTLVHPIAYGVFCASLTALAVTVHTRRSGSKIFWGSVVSAAAFCSVSSAALLAVLLQFAMLGFERFTRFVRSRWQILAVVFGAAYLFVEIVASHSPIAILVSKFALNASTANNRLLIFEYGSAEVFRHPIFGIGNNDWVRATWMVASIDNHWLLRFMRYGVLGGGAIMGAVIGCMIIVARSPAYVSDALKAAQRGWLICMIAFFVALGTVAINVEVNSYYMTLVAGGLWIADRARLENHGQAEELNPRDRRRKHRRELPKRGGIPPETTPLAERQPKQGRRELSPKRELRRRPKRKRF